MKILNVRLPGLSGGPAPALLTYCAASILMTVTNKAVLSSYNFHLNFFLLAIQSIICVVVLEVCAFNGALTHRPFCIQTAKKWFPVSLALVAMIYTGSRALQYLSIPLVTVFKNLTIVIIAFSEFAFMGGTKITPIIGSSFVLIIASSIIAGWGDLSSGNLYTDRGKDVGYFVPYAWMTANCLATAFYSVVMRGMIKTVQFKDYDTVFYNNVLSIPVLLLFSLVLEAPVYDTLVDDYDTFELYGLIAAISVSSVCAFGISFATAWCLRVSTSTTYSIVGALNKLPIAIAGMALFGDPVTFTSVTGVMTAFAAGLVYSYGKNQMASAEKASLPTSTSKEALLSSTETIEVKVDVKDPLLRSFDGSPAETQAKMA